MTTPDDERDFASLAEHRLNAHLEALREPALASEAGITRSVANTLRWQRMVLVPLRAGGAIAYGLLEGVRLVLGSPKERR
jgi:hypothetical protein